MPPTTPTEQESTGAAELEALMERLVCKAAASLAAIRILYHSGPRQTECVRHLSRAVHQVAMAAVVLGVETNLATKTLDLSGLSYWWVNAAPWNSNATATRACRERMATYSNERIEALEAQLEHCAAKSPEWEEFRAKVIQSIGRDLGGGVVTFSMEGK